MRRLGLVLLAFMLLGLAAAALPGLEAKVPNQQVVAAYFPRPVIFADAMLYGNYLIVHDDDNAEMGEPCLFIYRNAGEHPLVGVHCKRVKRDKAETFKVVTRRLTASLKEITEIQFGGTDVGHQIR